MNGHRSGCDEVNTDELNQTGYDKLELTWVGEMVEGRAEMTADDSRGNRFKL